MLINDEKELNRVPTLINEYKGAGYFVLGNDITCSGRYPAGEYVDGFKGTFDGCGYTITTSVPLFDTLSGAVINLNVDGEISYSVTPEAPVANKLVDAFLNAEFESGGRHEDRVNMLKAMEENFR